MACEIRLTATVQQIPEIRTYLFPNDDQKGTDFWLTSCKLSTSPTGDLIVLGNKRRLVVLSSKWDSSSSLSSFQISFSGVIHEYDSIKSILCLPLVVESNSSHTGPDWSCIAIGYDSGYVRFYTESGELLYEEQFHNENIASIKCQSQHSPRPDLLPGLYPEELYIQYQSNVCIVNGQQLFYNLRNFRAQLARAQAKGSPTEFNPIPLHVKKWGFSNQDSINDVIVVGSNITNTFDHLLSTSLCNGFEALYRSSPPCSTLILAAGSKPFLGYHYAIESVTIRQPVLGDVAKVVANKLKSALPDWLTGSKPNDPKETTISMRPVASMSLRFGLCDLRRTGVDIILSPNRKLAAVSDNLGRVLLIDTFRGTIIKVFKGYREAQCAFVQVPDERRSKHRIGNKVALFLIIYSSKKATIEIFTVQQGHKIATFSVLKQSRLLYITHSLMGFIQKTKSRYVCQFTCLFLDTEGQISEIMVPFHFALAEKNSIRAKDIYILKKIRQLIKTDTVDADEMSDELYMLFTELKTIEFKRQVLDILKSSKSASAGLILRCVNHTLDQEVEEEESDSAATYKSFCQNLKDLLQFYLYFSKQSDDGAKEEYSDILNVDPKDLPELQKLLDLATSNCINDLKAPRVTFSETSEFGVSDFLSSFDLSESKHIHLKKDLEDYQLFKTGEVIFQRYISGKYRDLDGLAKAIIASHLSIKNLFLLAIQYWLDRALNININLEKDMNNFSNVITILIKLAKEELGINFESDLFWDNFRDLLANSTRSFSSLMAAMLCKNVVQRYELDDIEDNIVVLTDEIIQWSLLIGKLEDVSILNIILTNKPNFDFGKLPKLSFERSDVSLKHILEHGRGTISELTAQWLTSCGMDPDYILVSDKVLKSRATSVDKTAEEISDYELFEKVHQETINIVKTEPVFNHLNLLRQQFPYSLEESCLLANMCWEYAVSWRKNITNIDYLQAALKCLYCIPNHWVRRGLFQLIWKIHIKFVFESGCKLINKAGKLPKDRLCLQDTGLTDKQLSDFFGISHEFLNNFLRAAESTFNSTRPTLQYEAFWECGGPQPLVELAVEQKDINYELLYLHSQLGLVLYMMTNLTVKHAKPINNLFEVSLGSLFFTDFQREIDINWNKSDANTNGSREQFLTKIINSSLETITLNADGEVYCREHLEWMEQCELLAGIWNLNVDNFRRYRIVQLYISGYDSVADELQSMVSDRQLLGEEILTVACKRLSQFLRSAPNFMENVAVMTPTLKRYVDNLNGNWCCPSNLIKIEALAKRALVNLDEDHQHKHIYQLAEEVVETCERLREVNSE